MPAAPRAAHLPASATASGPQPGFTEQKPTSLPGWRSTA